MKIVRYDDNDEEVLEEEKEFILGEGCSANIPEGIEIALLKFRLRERSLIYLKNKYAAEGVNESNSDSDVEVKYEVTLISFERVSNKERYLKYFSFISCFMLSSSSWYIRIQ